MNTQMSYVYIVCQSNLGFSLLINPRLDEPDSARGSGKRKRAVAAVRRAMSKVSWNKNHVMMGFLHFLILSPTQMQYNKDSY